MGQRDARGQDGRQKASEREERQPIRQWQEQRERDQQRDARADANAADPLLGDYIDRRAPFGTAREPAADHREQERGDEGNGSGSRGARPQKR